MAALFLLCRGGGFGDADGEVGVVGKGWRNALRYLSSLDTSTCLEVLSSVPSPGTLGLLLWQEERLEGLKLPGLGMY